MVESLIKNRRAVYPVQYSDVPVTKEEIITLLEAANWAPTHRRTEPWRFKVMQGEVQGKFADFLAEKYKESTNNFSEVKYNKYKTNPRKAAAIIAICMKRDPAESIPKWEEIAATSMAVQNMWLQASAMQIGAYWGSPAVSKYFHEFIPLDEGVTCLGFLYLGKLKENLPEGHRKTSIHEKVTWHTT